MDATYQLIFTCYNMEVQNCHYILCKPHIRLGLKGLKHHTVTNLKGLTSGLDPSRWHGCSSIFIQRFHLNVIVLTEWKDLNPLLMNNSNSAYILAALNVHSCITRCIFRNFHLLFPEICYYEFGLLQKRVLYIGNKPE